jgi:hypothetical protein
LIRANLATSLEFHEVLLHELAAALRELYTWVLVDKAFMELTECLVLLSDCPNPFVVKADFDEVLGVSPVVHRVIRNDCILDLAI